MSQSQSLCERLGGEDRIQRLVTDVVDNHLRNPLIRPAARNTTMPSGR